MAFEEGVLTRHPPLVQCPRHAVQEFVVVEGLDDVIDGARTQRADRAFERRKARNHDNRQLGTEAPHRADGVEPGAVGQPEIGNHEIDPGSPEALEARFDRARAGHRVTLAREQQLDHFG